MLSFALWLTATCTLTALSTTFAIGPESAVRPHRIPWGQEYYGEPSALYNPAAVFHPKHGWVTLFRLDKCFYEKCGIHKTNTSVIVADMGQGSAPDIDKGVKSAAVWEYEKASFDKLLADNNCDKFALGDFRPFLYKGDVYASFWIKFGWSTPNPPPQHVCWSTGWGDPHSCEYTAYGKLDFAAKQLQMTQQFAKPVLGASFKPEKNWGFLEQDGQLLLIYSLLPCTVIYRVDPTADKGAVFDRSFCYSSPELVEASTNHAMPTSRLSGHPQLWQHADGTSELLLLVHSRIHHNSYHNWAVRVDPATLKVTHITAGPIIKSTDFAVEGYLKGVLVVSSFHVVDVGGQETLRLFMGEGDQFSDWQDVPLSQVNWWAVDPALAVPMKDEQAVTEWSRRHRRLLRQ
ncbi:hypothetical protein WJX72_005882 [[Myrmecia] bisecta]|uniref:Uncharacterized protein n=1 Tax=[Myrmecia] bisecta TaxID=41462 RepID=A0AAW1P595_9CHLO